MKQKKQVLLSIILLCFCIGMAAQSVNMTNVTVKQALAQLQQNCGYSFVYEVNDLNANKRVSVKADNCEEALAQLLHEQGVSYTMKGKTVIISKKSSPSNHTRSQQDGNKRSVKGIVKDMEGEPIIGASIRVKDREGSGTISDLDGSFELNVSPGDQLEITYVGFGTRTVKVGNSSSLSIILKEDDKALDEVVVVGYGTMKKSDLTGTTVQIKPSAITSSITGNALETLQGKAAGVAVFNNNQPGASPSIRVRGSGSISASNEPLYVVDGFPLMDADISDLNPSDIESMEILKDASATAIYGSRGANGVVMITTKKGHEGMKNLNISSSFGVQFPGRKMNLITEKDFINFENAAYINQGGEPIFKGNEKAATNWEDEILKSSAIVQDYNLNFNGQSGSTQYMTSGGYYKQDGLIPTQNYEKFSFHTNVSHKFNSWLILGANVQYTYATRNNQDNALGNVPRYGWATDSPTDENGNYVVPDNPYVTDAWNPLKDFHNETHRIKTNRIILNCFTEMKLLKHLTYRLSIGQDIRNHKGYDFYTSQTVSNSRTGKGSGGHNWFRNRSKVMENVLTYANQWDVHRFTVTGVYSWQDFVYENLGINGSGFEMDQTGAWDMNLADRSTVAYNSNKYANKLISFTGRVTYAYNDKYLLTATSRLDGSSRFGMNNKWGYFPSLGLGWRISQEKFLTGNSIISDLKVRTSFGVTGNQEIGNYRSLPRLTSDTSNGYTDGTDYLIGFYESIGNNDLKWERTSQWNFGADIGLYNRININFDYYTRNTRDLLYNVPIPSTSGYSTILSNIGQVQNNGWELTIGANIYKDKEWSIDASINATYNKNRIKELYGGVNKVVIQDQSMGLSRRLIVGQAVDAIYAYHSLGIIRTQEQLEAYKKSVPSVASTAKLGDEMYQDTNEDGTLSADDYICIGSIQPKYFYGLNLNISYKQFSLAVYAQGGLKYASIAGSENSSTKGSAWAIGYSNLSSYLLYGENQVSNLTYIPTQYAYDRMWSETNPNGNFPAAGAHNTFLSDRTNGDWNYFILKNIQLAYNLTSLIHVKTIRSLSVSLNFQNFVTIANHRGYNPVNGDISNPWAKSVTLGINIKF